MNICPKFYFWCRDATWDPAEPHKTSLGWGGGDRGVDETGAAQLSPLGEKLLGLSAW
jgi:hypothetical protein